MTNMSGEMILAGAKALFKRDVEEDVLDGEWDDEENEAVHERILADSRACLTAALSNVVVVPKMSHDDWKVGDKVFHKHAGERGEVTKIENGDIHVQFTDYEGVYDRAWFGTYPDSLSIERVT